jgi:deoxyinosine 3'endonuclease (endonuclease V)
MKCEFRLAVATVVLVLVAVPGCGVAKTKVTGKLMKNGQPLKVSKDTYVTLTFAPDIENPGQTYPAKFNQETGGYEIELPAGKYRARYVIMEKGQPAVSAPPEATKEVHDLTRSKELNIEIIAK